MRHSVYPHQSARHSPTSTSSLKPDDFIFFTSSPRLGTHWLSLLTDWLSVSCAIRWSSDIYS